MHRRNGQPQRRVNRDRERARVVTPTYKGTTARRRAQRIVSIDLDLVYAVCCERWTRGCWRAAAEVDKQAQARQAVVSMATRPTDGAAAVRPGPSAPSGRAAMTMLQEERGACSCCATHGWLVATLAHRVRRTFTCFPCYLLCWRARARARARVSVRVSIRKLSAFLRRNQEVRILPSQLVPSPVLFPVLVCVWCVCVCVFVCLPKRNVLLG